MYVLFPAHIFKNFTNCQKHIVNEYFSYEDCYYYIYKLTYPRHRRQPYYLSTPTNFHFNYLSMIPYYNTGYRSINLDGMANVLFMLCLILFVSAICATKRYHKQIKQIEEDKEDKEDSEPTSPSKQDKEFVQITV